MLLLFSRDPDTLLSVPRARELLQKVGIMVTERMIYHYRKWLTKQGLIKIVEDAEGKKVQLTEEGMDFVKKCLDVMDSLAPS